MEPVKGSPQISLQNAVLRQSVQHRVSFLRLPSYTLSRCAGLPLKGKQGLAAELAMCCLSPAKHSAEFATPPLVPYGTTFLHGKASHLVLRSLSLPYEPSSLATPLCGVSPAERARGNAFPSPARAVVWFYHNGALYFFRGAHQDLCSLSDSDATLGPCVSRGAYGPLRPTAAGPFGNTDQPTKSVLYKLAPFII